MPNIDVFLVNHHYHSDGVSYMGDIIIMTDIREVLELVPVFGKTMCDMNANNSLEIANSFHIHYFSGKETFHAILGYQKIIVSYLTNLINFLTS